MGTLSFSQDRGEVTVYSNTGEKFFVILNGIRQNDQAQTNVKITGLSNPYYKCKVISANRTFELDKNIIVKQDTLITYEIKEKKGKYKMRFYSETLSASAPKADPSQSTVIYHSVENPMHTNTQNTTVNPNSGHVNTTMNTTTTTVTSNTSNDFQNGNVNESMNMNISIGENGISTNMNISENGMNGENMNMNTNMNSSETITTNTSSTSSTINGQTTYEETITTTTSTTENGNTTYYEETITTTSNSNQGNIYQDQDMIVTMETADNCYMSNQDADNLANQVANEAFPDDRLRVANTAAKNKCMTVNQINNVAKRFDHPENKLSFLKSAYDRCTDKSNYYQLMETLTFPSDKEELEKYINSRR